MLLADGARADVLEELLRAGELPALAEHVVDRGGLYQASSVFASTTGPAHLPFLTGLFPGTAGVPGIRWFDRRRGLPGVGLGMLGLRSYCGYQAGRVDRDLSPDCATLFEQCRDSVNVFGCIKRGVEHDLWSGRKNWLWLWGHETADYRLADQQTGAALEQVARRSQAEFTWVMFPGIDGHSHHYSPWHRRTLASYRVLDRALGRAARALQQRGTYQDTLLLVASDHGHTPVRGHWDLALYLQQGRGQRVAYHSRRTWVPRPQAVVCVSGNGMAHLYFPSRHGWRSRPGEAGLRAQQFGLLEELLVHPAVDLLLVRDEDSIVLLSQRGRARVWDAPGGVRYRTEGEDPLGLPALPERLDAEQALQSTFHGPYPDGLMQAAQMLRTPRSGDVMVSAAPGWDLRRRYERKQHRSGHGALHRQHMQVPVACSAPLVDGPMRTTDLHSSALEWLGRTPLYPVDGRSRLAAGSSPV